MKKRAIFSPREVFRAKEEAPPPSLSARPRMASPGVMRPASTLQLHHDASSRKAKADMKKLMTTMMAQLGDEDTEMDESDFF